MRDVLHRGPHQRADRHRRSTTSDPNAGNLPLDRPEPRPRPIGPSDIVTLIPASLDYFWTDLADANGVPFTRPRSRRSPPPARSPRATASTPAAWPQQRACSAPADNTIYWDQDFALELSHDPLTGDMSVGYLFSNAYSDAIQTALRSQPHAASRGRCSTTASPAPGSAYIVPPIPEDREISSQLSAGDLDEAIVTAIARSDESTDTNVNGSAFEKIDAFRTGVLGGLNVCRNEIS